PTKWLLFFNLRGSHKYSSDIFARLNHAGTGTKEYAKHRRANCMPDRYLVDIFELIKNLLAKNDDVAGERSPFLRVVILTRTAAEATFFTKRKLCRLVEIARPAPDEEPGGWARTAVSRLMEDMLTARKRIATKNGDEGKQAEVKFHAGLRRLRSLAMFPQVKHLSSLVTRAVDGFPSDGDEGWKATDEQMNDLLRRRIIRAKTGGFLYMHWDVREELRYSLNRHFGRELEPVRADLHIGQADWSMTLFESTRDPLAAYQAVYHRCTAARLLVWGTSGNEHERLVKARVAICEAVKHLSRAHSSIFAWGNSIDASRCFKGFAQFVEVVINKTGPKNERHLQFLMKAYIESNVLHCALLRDTGRTGQLGQLVAKLQRVMSNEPPVSGKLHKAWKTFERHSRVDAKGLNFSILLERINVLVTRRRYDEAIRRCNELLEHECCGFPIEKCGSKQEPGNIWKHVYKWGEDHAKLGSDTREYRFEIRILAVQVLRRLLEIHLLQFEALLVHCDYVVGEDQVSEFTSKADAYYQTARMIPRLITNGNDPRVLVAVSRLHSIISGVMSHGRQEKRVWRHLNEAEIPASALPESESHIAKTVILLRRVYCRMQGLRWSGTLLDSYRRRRDANLANVHLTLSEEDQTKVEAWLSEINAQLDEAGRRLARDRKSLWWWVSYARYRMVWFLQREMLRSFRFQELGKAIKANAPKHTYEHLELHRLRLFQSHEMESALHLLNGVTRRVVDDSYQLCRIADTCLDITRYVAQLPSNLESLRQRTFSDALQRVLEIEGAIKNAFEGDGQRDGNVTAYINKVVEKLERECSAQPSRSRVMGSQREVDSFKA
ncbi:MAG: hypothetical protein JNG86_16685, partial [Verrucomicrobiaceae bacterium]|nr:hypothetical protein [Verrucomicrobiaceae bacterium]